MKKKALTAGCFAILLVASSVSSWAQDAPLDSKNWPTTVEDAVRDFLSHASPAVKNRFRATKKEDIILLYGDWGRDVRNRYGLWLSNEKLLISACGKPCHPDDASLIIIEAIWRETRK